MNIDCGHCGNDEVIQKDGIYICSSCGKTYTPDEAIKRNRSLETLKQKRKMQIIFMVVCMVFLVLTAILLPGYSNDGSHAEQILITTALSVLFFSAALIERICFGRIRKQLYSE